MLHTRDRIRRVQRYSHALIAVGALVLIISLTALPSTSPAAVTIARPIRGVPAEPFLVPATHHVSALARHPRARSVDAELADFTSHPSAADGYVVTLIHRDFPARAWHDAEAVAWCESKFRTTDIGFDSNGTHDRGVFQLNDGGTEQFLMAMIGQNPKNLNLAFNPVLNVRAAAVLYARDGWSQWSCESAI